MADLKKIEADLGSADGFKKYVGGLLKGVKANKAYKIWKAAEKRGVAPIYSVRKDKYDTNKYQVIVWPYGKFDFDEVEEFASQIPLGTIRYNAATAFHAMSRSWGEEGAHRGEERFLSDEFRDRFNAHANVVTNHRDYGAVIYAWKDGKEYILLVNEKKIK
jgi:hypothetical protein